jgi:hypothetical protein
MAPDPRQSAREDLVRGQQLDKRHAAVEPECDPITKFKRVWESESNSGTEEIKGF